MKILLKKTSKASGPVSLEDTLRQLERVANKIGKTNITSSGSVLPYYTEEVALEVQELVTRIVGTGEPLNWVNPKWSANTVKNRWYQGRKYTLDHMDPEGTFKRLFSCVVITMIDYGIRISPAGPEAGLQVLPVDTNWKDDLQKFIADETAIQFERIGLSIDTADLRYIESLLIPHKDDFVWQLDLQKIFIARIAAYRTELAKLEDKPDLV